MIVRVCSLAIEHPLAWPPVQTPPMPNRPIGANSVLDGRHTLGLLTAPPHASACNFERLSSVIAVQGAQAAFPAADSPDSNAVETGDRQPMAQMLVGWFTANAAMRPATLGRLDKAPA